MKTLYRILGLDSQATIEQIETAYRDFSARVQSGVDGLSDEEVNNQKVAIRDAYKTLSNPILRQRYDQKLADADFARNRVQAAPYYETSNESIFGLKSIALIGLIVLASLYFYTQSAKDREKLRIEHEHQVKMKEIQIAEDRQKQNAKVQDVVLEKSSTYSDAYQLRMSQQQFERESAQAQQLDIQRQRLELQQQQQQQRVEDNRQKQEQQRRQQQLQSEKRLLQQMERDRYGKVITH